MRLNYDCVRDVLLKLEELLSDVQIISPGSISVSYVS